MEKKERTRKTGSISSAAKRPAQPRTKRLDFPDIFGGEEKKTRPASVTILADRPAIFSFLRDFANLPLFLKYVTRVERTKTGHRWAAEYKEGQLTEWETEILEESPNQLIAWRTKPEAPMQQTGAFLLEDAPGGRGTVVSLKLTNDSAFARITNAFEKFRLEDPDSEALRELQRLKAYLETGEVPTVEGQPTGRSEDAENANAKPARTEKEQVA